MSQNSKPAEREKTSHSQTRTSGGSRGMKQPKKCTKSTNKTATKGLSPYEMEELLSLWLFSAEEAKKVESELREWPFEVA